MLLTCGGLAALTYAAHLVSDAHPQWLPVAALGLASVVLLVVATWHLLRTEAPLVDLRTLRIPTFGNAMVGSSLIWLVIGAIPFLLPLLFQTVFGWSPIKSGALVLFVFVGNIAIKPLTTPMYSNYGFRRVLVAASVVLTLTTVGCALLTRDTPLVVIALLSLISGAARSVSMTGYTTLALSDVPPAQMRAANALASTAQQLFTGLAVVLATIALRLGDAVGKLGAAAHDARFAYVIAFLVISVVGAIATAVALPPPSLGRRSAHGGCHRRALARDDLRAALTTLTLNSGGASSCQLPASGGVFHLARGASQWLGGELPDRDLVRERAGDVFAADAADDLEHLRVTRRRGAAERAVLGDPQVGLEADWELWLRRGERAAAGAHPGAIDEPDVDDVPVLDLEADRAVVLTRFSAIRAGLGGRRNTREHERTHAHQHANPTNHGPS